MNIQITSNITADIAFIADERIESILPNPENEIGPNTTTKIPPPTKSKSHMTKRNRNI